MTEGSIRRRSPRLHRSAHPLYEGDGSSRRLTKFTDVRLLRRTLRDVVNRNHSPSRPFCTGITFVPAIFSIIPLMGLADVVVNGACPSICRAQTFFSGETNYLPSAHRF